MTPIVLLYQIFQFLQERNVKITNSTPFGVLFVRRSADYLLSTTSPSTASPSSLPELSIGSAVGFSSEPD